MWVFICGSAFAGERPNILLILADDLGATEPSPTGSVFRSTPDLGRLAQRGMLFTNAYIASPLGQAS